MQHADARTCRDDMVHGEDVGSRAKVRMRDVAEAYALDLVELPKDCSSEAVCHMVVEEELEHIQASPLGLV